jgi:hypothetical protein
MCGARRDIGQHQIRAREDAERVEVVLADPDRVHADPVGLQGFLGNIADELVRRARIVLLVIVADREVAEFHVPRFSSFSPAAPCIIDAMQRF